MKRKLLQDILLPGGAISRTFDITVQCIISGLIKEKIEEEEKLLLSKMRILKLHVIFFFFFFLSNSHKNNVCFTGRV